MVDPNGTLPPMVGGVLAGGRARRMGVDKAVLEIGGRPMIGHVLDALADAGLPAIVAGPPRPGIEARFVADPPGRTGPVAGLAAIAAAFPAAIVALVGCDQPFLRPTTILRLLEVEGEIVVPVNHRRQPLCAVYAPSVAGLVDAVSREDDGAPPLARLLDRAGTVEVHPTKWRSWGEDGRSWLSIDDPRTLAAARVSWPEPPLTTIPP
jgi:molybdopterin-guanine dinucleotide biosynthesis protein A